VHQPLADPRWALTPFRGRTLSPEGGAGEGGEVQGQGQHHDDVSTRMCGAGLSFCGLARDPGGSPRLSPATGRLEPLCQVSVSQAMPGGVVTSYLEVSE
jgi:hypothetical protein